MLIAAKPTPSVMPTKNFPSRVNLSFRGARMRDHENLDRGVVDAAFDCTGSGRVGFAYGRGVFILFFRRHQVAIGPLGARPLLRDFLLQPRTLVPRIVAPRFHRPNIKSALVELFLDLSAPQGCGFYLCL